MNALKNNNSKVIYLDANFLVDWFIRKQPTIKKRARILLVKLLTQFDILTFSPLTIDESWKGIKEEIDIKRFHSYSEDIIFSQLENFTKKILTHNKMKIVQLQNLRDGILYALNLLRRFLLEPRDSFHLAIMKDNEIIFIVTRDEKIIKNQSQIGIKVIMP